MSETAKIIEQLDAAMAADLPATLAGLAFAAGAFFFSAPALGGDFKPVGIRAIQAALWFTLAALVDVFGFETVEALYDLSEGDGSWADWGIVPGVEVGVEALLFLAGVVNLIAAFRLAAKAADFTLFARQDMLEALREVVRRGDPTGPAGSS